MVYLHAAQQHPPSPRFTQSPSPQTDGWNFTPSSVGTGSLTQPVALTWPFLKKQIIWRFPYMGVLAIGMVYTGNSMKIIFKWMIWGCLYFRKPPSDVQTNGFVRIQLGVLVIWVIFKWITSESQRNCSLKIQLTNAYLRSRISECAWKLPVRWVVYCAYVFPKVWIWPSWHCFQMITFLWFTNGTCSTKPTRRSLLNPKPSLFAANPIF